MKIGHPETPGAAPAAAATERKPAPAAAGTPAAPAPAASTSPEASTQVALSTAAQVATPGMSTSEFDAEKVQRIAQAIREGRFTVNPEAIADKLIANAQELLSGGTH